MQSEEMVELKEEQQEARPEWTTPQITRLELNRTMIASGPFGDGTLNSSLG